MEKQQLIAIAKEIHAGKIAIRQATAGLSTDDFCFVTDLLSAMERNARAEEEPKQAEEHHAIAALICEQIGIDPEEIEEKQEEEQTILIHLKETGHIDIAASREAYLLAGRPRQEMLKHLAAKIAAVCDDLDEDAGDVQIRLAANAIMLPGEGSYRTKEAFWKSRKELHKDA